MKGENIMDLIEKAYSCTKLWISMIVAIIYSVLLVSYQHHIQGLENMCCHDNLFNIMFYRNCNIEGSPQCGYDDKFSYDNNNDCAQ